MGIFLGCLLIFAAACPGQSRPDVPAQREAMKKLGFLVGKWAGPALVTRGPGEPVRITQTEEVQYKLDGLVLLIEGTGRDAEGKVVFQALATVSYDNANHTYRLRSYNDGRFLDTEWKALPKGFSWGYEAGPPRVVNTMRLNDAGDWIESTESAFGDSPSRKVLEMTLRRLP